VSWRIRCQDQDVGFVALPGGQRRQGEQVPVRGQRLAQALR
jgi:hypothetical protein